MGIFPAHPVTLEEAGLRCLRLFRQRKSAAPADALKLRQLLARGAASP